jgi:hypothetical protein
MMNTSVQYGGPDREPGYVTVYSISGASWIGLYHLLQGRTCQVRGTWTWEVDGQTHRMEIQRAMRRVEPRRPAGESHRRAIFRPVAPTGGFGEGSSTSTGVVAGHRRGSIARFIWL